MSDNLKREVLIIGGGAAGLNAAFNIKDKNAFLIETGCSNSAVSPWNLMVKEESKLRKKILKSGNKMNNEDLLDVFLSDYRESINDLKKLGVKFKESNIGLIPDCKMPFSEIREKFLKKIKNVKFLKGRVTNFLVDGKNIKGVKVFLNSSEEKNIFFNHLILAAGGINEFFPFSTGKGLHNGSILSLCHETGFLMRDMEFFMFHPFLIVDKKLPKLLISGEILTKIDFRDEKGRKVFSKEVSLALKNNNHHDIFPKINREIYFKSQKSKIFAVLNCSKEWFKKFKKENEFGFIFNNVSFKDIEKFEVKPAFHFLIGGLNINKNSETNYKNIYAAGEITGGLHGSNRMGGMGISEALVFSKKAAININKKRKSKVIVPEKLKEKGKLGLSEELKELVWEALGPVKKESKMKELNSLLEKKELTSEEKLLKKINEISLKREKSIGSFLREGSLITETSFPYFLKGNKIFFQKNA